MIKNSGSIQSGNLKGVTANRNITAFQLHKFHLFYLLYINSKGSN